MECFRIDESGYTGFDLLNNEQRFQGASAISINDDDAERLIKQYFPNSRAPELKYNMLSRRKSNHPRLLGLIKCILDNFKSVTYICDKRFMLTLMFIDYAVEPYYYERGFDLYTNGQNYATASVLHLAGPKLLGESQFRRLMASFQHAMKDKSGKALNELVAAAKATNWERLPEIIGPLAQHGARECLSAIATPELTTDIAMIVLTSLIARMEMMADAPYCVQHDQSKNLENYHQLLQRFIKNKDKIEFRATEITTFRFPLMLTAVEQVDSKRSPAVQLADVMIGAAIEGANNLAGLRTGGLDPEQLMALYTDEQIIHLLPSIDFEEQLRFRKGTQASELIDYFAANLIGPKY